MTKGKAEQLLLGPETSGTSKRSRIAVVFDEKEVRCRFAVDDGVVRDPCGVTREWRRRAPFQDSWRVDDDVGQVGTSEMSWCCCQLFRFFYCC